MAKTNKKPQHDPIYTAEGAKAVRINAEQELRRSVLTCMLWEDIHYEEGEEVINRIETLCKVVNLDVIAEIAREARTKQKLRHVPLKLCVELAKRAYPKTSEVIFDVVQRADELTELLSLYWAGGKTPISAQMKKGLAKAFTKFNEYHLSKYNRDEAIKLRDVLFLSHAKPKDQAQADLWKRLIDKKLTVPDTWETNLSVGKDKKETWERLISEKKLGAMAFLRNLRNMQEAGVPLHLISDGLKTINTERVLPFRFVTAARYAPKLEESLEGAMFKCLAGYEKLPGKTILIVDTSGSMFGSGNISKHSELTRIDAAGALAVLIREVCENPVIYATAGDDSRRIHATKLLPPRRGFALQDLLCKRSLQREIGGGGIFLKQVMDYVYDKEKEADRIIVITDEQDCGTASGDHPSKANAFGKINYLINVSVDKNGIGYGKWTHFDGWSESIIDFIIEYEKGKFYTQ